MPRAIRKNLFWIIVIAVAAPFIFLGFAHDKFFPVVEGKIYRSAQLSGHRLQHIIAEKKIRAIINLRGKDEDGAWYQMESDIARQNNVKIFNIRLPAHDLPAYTRLNELFDTLCASPRPLLIHCWRGADRAGMASALALIIEGESSLEEAKKQFSWRYGVAPFLDSVGNLVFSEYETWLKNRKLAHSLPNLTRWIRQEYTDNAGNIIYYVDGTDYSEFGSDHIVVIPPDARLVNLKGWAVHAGNLSRVENLRVGVADGVFQKARYGVNRPDVAAYVGAPPSVSTDYVVGWTATFDADAFSPGCYPIRLAFERDGGAAVDIFTDFKLCFR